eukprot:g4434.t1
MNRRRRRRSSSSSSTSPVVRAHKRAKTSRENDILNSYEDSAQTIGQPTEGRRRNRKRKYSTSSDSTTTKRNAINPDIVDLSGPSPREKSSYNFLPDSDPVYDYTEKHVSNRGRRKKRKCQRQYFPEEKRHDERYEQPGDLERIMQASRQAEKYAADRRLRAQQDAEMELSRALDLSKEAQLQEEKREASLLAEMEQKKLRQEQAAADARLKRCEELLINLPPEPPKSDVSAFDLCVSLTTGKRLRRRFTPNCIVATVLDWAEGNDIGEEVLAAPVGSYGLLLTGPPKVRFYRNSQEIQQTLDEVDLNGVHLRGQLRI